MSTAVVSVIAALLSAVLAAIGTYLAARRDLQLKFDASLRDLRLEAYRELWKELEHLAKYGRPDPLSRSEAQQLRDTLRKWYFQTGGLVLSADTRQDYFALLDGLELVTRRSATAIGEPSDASIVRGQDDEFLRVLGSRLRTAMTRDVGTRRTFVFRGDPERGEPPLETRTYVEDGGNRQLEISRTSGTKLARILKLPRRLLRSDDPKLKLLRSDDPKLSPQSAELVRWDPGRRALTIRLAPSPADVGAEERLVLMEDGYMVEGPKGWRRGELGHRAPSVIWKESKDPARSDD